MKKGVEQKLTTIIESFIFLNFSKGIFLVTIPERCDFFFFGTGRQHNFTEIH